MLGKCPMYTCSAQLTSMQTQGSSKISVLTSMILQVIHKIILAEFKEIIKGFTRIPGANLYYIKTKYAQPYEYTIRINDFGTYCSLELYYPYYMKLGRINYSDPATLATIKTIFQHGYEAIRRNTEWIAPTSKQT